MKLRLATLGVVALLVTGLSLTAATAAPAAPPDATGVTATLTNAGVPINGTLSDLHVVNQAGDLVLSGTFTDAVTGIATDFETTILQATGSCQILDLTLGPLDLNLLGLVVHLDTVHLNITAERGPGNLLGNLLCAVAGLLDTNGGTNALTTLLNRLLGGL